MAIAHSCYDYGQKSPSTQILTGMRVERNSSGSDWSVHALPYPAKAGQVGWAVVNPDRGYPGKG